MENTISRNDGRGNMMVVEERAQGEYGGYSEKNLRSLDSKKQPKSQLNIPRMAMQETIRSEMKYSKTP